MISIKAETVLNLHVKCTKELNVGQTIDGELNVIPIIGGEFSGKINGKVVSGGANWNTKKANEVSHVFAKYVLLTDEGEYIAIENEGVINWNEETIIKAKTKFTVSENSKLSWLNSGVYVGSLEGGELMEVDIKIHKLM